MVSSSFQADSKAYVVEIDDDFIIVLAIVYQKCTYWKKHYFLEIGMDFS